MTEKTAGLNIKAVSERTGVPLHSLRAWERRYGVPRPARVPNNRYRVYGDQDIADVLWMKRQVEAGVSPAHASAMLRQQGHNPVPPALPSAQPLADRRAALFSALTSSDEAASNQVLDEAWALYSPEQVMLQIIQPTLKEIGEQWLKNKISVSQEHFASNLIRQRLLAILQAQSPLPASAPRLVAACAPEEQHELGLVVFSLLARRQGWHVTYLGQRTPLGELAQLAASVKLVVMSVSTPTGLASLVPLWVPENRPHARLVFGGDIFNQVPILREHIPGVFLGADALEAVRTLTTFAARPRDWSPAPKMLNAAMALQAERLHIIWETLAQLFSAGRGIPAVRRALHSQQLSGPTIFLVDLVVSALAFEASELMDAQGAWLSDLLIAHGIEERMLKLHFDSFARACHEFLPREAAEQVAPLVEQLLASAHTRLAVEKHQVHV